MQEFSQIITYCTQSRDGELTLRDGELTLKIAQGTAVELRHYIYSTKTQSHATATRLTTLIPAFLFSVLKNGEWIVR